MEFTDPFSFRRLFNLSMSYGGVVFLILCLGPLKPLLEEPVTPELLRAVLDGNAESLQGLIRQAAEAVAAAAGASAPASVQQPESIAAETKRAAASAAQAGGTAQARFESSEKLIGAPDAFIAHASVSEQTKDNHMDAESVKMRALKALGREME